MSITNSFSRSHRILLLNTLAFTACLACWTFNGVSVTFLVDNGIFKWDVVQVGWLLGIPILTGSIMRLPIGILTYKFGEKYVFSILLLICSIPLFLLPYADSFAMSALLSFFFGMVGMTGGLGGFFGPIIFGYLLTATGVWSSSWIFILVLSAVCLIWMNITITRMMNEKQPVLSKEMDRK